MSLFSDHILGPDTHANRPASAPKRTLYVCTTHNTMDYYDGAAWQLWATLDGLGGSTLTTKGDLLTRTGSAVARQAVGADATSLVADSGQANGIKWENRVKSVVAGTNITVDNTDPLNPVIASSGGGGGGGSAFALDPVTLNATYGDHFTGASLNARWSRAGSYVVGDETYQQGGGSFLLTASRTSGSYYYQTPPAGNFSIVMACNFHSSGSVMFGPCILDGSGNGVAGVTYNSSPNGPGTINVSGAAYGGTFNGNAAGVPQGSLVIQGPRVWYKLTKSGTSYTSYVSLNGYTWSPTGSSLTSAITPTRIGFGTFFGGNNIAAGLGVDFFDVQ